MQWCTMPVQSGGGEGGGVPSIISLLYQPTQFYHLKVHVFTDQFPTYLLTSHISPRKSVFRKVAGWVYRYIYILVPIVVNLVNACVS